MEKIPTIKLGRIRVYGSMATKVGLNTLGGKVKQVWSLETVWHNSFLTYTATHFLS